MINAKPTIEQAMSGQMGQPAACMIENNAGLLAAATRCLQGLDYHSAKRCTAPGQPVDKFVGNFLVGLIFARPCGCDIFFKSAE